MLRVGLYLRSGKQVNRSSSFRVLEAWRVIIRLIRVPDGVRPQVRSDAVLPARVGMIHHRSCHFLQLSNPTLSMAILVVRVDACKRYSLLIAAASLHPLVRLEDAVVCMVIGNSDTVSSCKSLKGLLAFDRLFSRGCLLKIHESHPATLIDVDRRILVPFGCQES